MKLFLSPGACSLSPHIVLREAELPFEAVKVDLKTHKLADGSDFHAISPNGYVPVLQLDSGEYLTEGPAIVQYLADLKPEKKLAPPNGTMARYRLQEHLNFISTELHKQFGPLFSPDTPDAFKQVVVAKIGKRFDFVTTELATRPYLMGDHFTVPDAYLFVMTTWAGFVGISLDKWPALVQFAERMRARPAVKTTLEAETALRKG
jgi:glutathione S-transferase